MKEKERWSKLRAEKIAQQTAAQENRIKRALERSQAPTKKKEGKPIMWRSTLPKKKKEEKEAEKKKNAQEEEDYLYFFT
jgi:hypothetical protein